MATITPANLNARVAAVLNDTGNVRWPTAELAYWMNDAQRQIVALKPDAYVVNTNYQMVAGVKQTLPDGTSSYQDADENDCNEALHLVEVVRNLGTDGATPGRVVTLIDRHSINTHNPDWTEATAAAEAVHYMYSDKDPKVFYVYPPQPSTNMGYLEVVYAGIPADADSTITLDDTYANAILQYMLHMVYAKSGEIPNNMQLADAAYAKFLAYLNIRDASETEDDPNAILRLRGGN